MISKMRWSYKIFPFIFVLFAAADGLACDAPSWDDDGLCVCICPVCECDASSRDNYAGVRIYANRHSSYSFKHWDGWREKQLDDDFGFGTTMGNNLTRYLRVEYETLYMGTQYSRHDTNFEYDIWANLLNAYALYEIDGAFAPYLGAGVGLTAIWGDVAGHLNSDVDLSAQAMVGILFRLNSRIDLDLGFKYVYFGKVEHKTGATRIDATQFYLGATYKFGM